MAYKIFNAADITLDEIFDNCYESDLCVIFLKHGGAAKDSAVRTLLAEQGTKKFIDKTCHEGHMKAKFSVVPTGFAVNLTQKCGIALKRGRAAYVLFERWTELGMNKKNATDMKKCPEFQLWLKRTPLYSTDYIILARDIEFT